MSADPEDPVIDLARETPFRLGDLEIRPATREAIGGGAPALLEPRVMQVLVALARRRGEVVSRDALIASCWGGRAVGEDAINRCVQALRRLADASGGFTLTTVARVGYRLDETPGAAPRSAEAVLAVLAFDNLSDDAALGYLSDGLSDDILQGLARLPSLKVIGRGSGFQLRAEGKAAANVSAMLGATHLLDGSVRKAGERLRINVHLVDCASQTTLWSDRYDRDASAMSVLADEIAAGAAASLGVATGPRPSGETVSPAAYDAYLKVVERAGERMLDAATLRDVTEQLERIVREAPSFARAWGHLAGARAAGLRMEPADGRPFAERRARVVEAAQTALRLDPGFGLAYHPLAAIEPLAAFGQREAMMNRALILAPNDPSVLAQTAFLACDVGRVGEALALARRALERDPLQPVAGYAYASFLDFQGRQRESQPLWDSLMARSPRSEVVALGALAAAVQARDWGRVDALATTAGDMAQARGLLWLAAALKAPDPEALQGAERGAEREVDRTGTLRLDRMVMLCEVGLQDAAYDLCARAAFDYMFDPEQAWPSYQPTLGYIFSVGAASALMRDPRFPSLCARLGLCDHWVASGRWPDCAAPGMLPYDFETACRRLAKS